MRDGPISPAWVLHDTFVEVLRRLNQAAARSEEIPDLEYPELERAMRAFWATHMGEVDLPFAVRLLLENGLIQSVENPIYAWDRGRILGSRYRITTLGKSYLVRQQRESGRIL